MELKKLFSVKNKTIIVTGASSGIGLEIAKSLHILGAVVHGISRKRIKNPRYDFHHSLDVTDEYSMKKIIKKIFITNNKINVLINNAGYTAPKSNIEKSYKEFDKTIAVNLKATYFLSKICADFMLARDRCSIINISSLGSILGFPGNPSYLASKGGLRSLTKGLALDLARKKIKVNCIVPGYIKTNMTKLSYSNTEERLLRTNRTIANKWGTPSDLIGATIFLSSHASDYINGQDIIVDGGWSAKGL